MNPQYINPGQPPLQNNNIPTSLHQSGDFHSQNANIYNQFSNGPPLEVTNKLQNMNLNGPQQGQIPNTQLPPGNFQRPPSNLSAAANGHQTTQYPPASTPNQNQIPSSLSSNQQTTSYSQANAQDPPPLTMNHPTSQSQTALMRPEQNTPTSQFAGSQPNQFNSQLNLQTNTYQPPQSTNFNAASQMLPSTNQGLNMPGQQQSKPSQPPSTQNIPGQQQFTGQLGQNQLPNVQPSLPGTPAQGHPPSNQGHQPPKTFQQPPMPGQQPPVLGQQPLVPGQKPQVPGQQQLPMPGQQHPVPGQQSQMPGQQPQIFGQQIPGQKTLVPNQQLNMFGQPPPITGQQQHMPGNQPLVPGQQQPMPGQQPQMTGHLPPIPGQQPPMPGQQPQMPGHQPLIPRQQPHLPGQQSQLPGQQPPVLGQQHSLQQLPPGQQLSFPNQQRTIGQQPITPGQQPSVLSQSRPNVQTGYQSQLPHMPPPLARESTDSRAPMGFQGQPGLGQPGLGQHAGMQPPQQQFPGQPPYGQPGRQPQYPGHPQQPPNPGQQQGFAGQPGVPSQQGFPAQQGFPGQQGFAGQQGFPGQQGYPGQPNQQPYSGYQQPQQPVKRLDPDQMPSPIQVMADDQDNRAGVFVTNEPGLVPPLVTTDFVVDDQGNASPRYIRSSMYSVPVNADLLKQTGIPFCLAISPMARTVGPERPPPLLDFAQLTNSPAMGPVRCCRCKAYMCPAMKFVDGGRHFRCAFCKATTEVPMEYTQYINSMQQYGRAPAEMALGAYEIVATKEYCRNNTLPNPPAIVFLIDVSYNAIKCGLVNTVCENIKNIIEALPKENGQNYTRVGFITYSSTVHFYNIKGSLCQPQMLSVGDVGEMFVPLLEGFLVLPEESAAVLDALMQQIPAMFADNKETEIIMLPAIQAGLEALKAADTAGQLLVFHTSLPSYPAPGKLINRDDRKALGSEKEKAVLAPANTTYNELGQALASAGVSVELFICNNNFVDIATIGQLSRLTGGGVNKYTYFQADIDGPRLIRDVLGVVSRPTALDAVMRVRTSTGVRATDFYGHMFMSNTTDVELAAIDADKSIAVEIKHDDKLNAEEAVYIQTALLYTHRTGQRRLRIINLTLNIAHQLADLFRSCELDTLVNFLSKQSVWALRESPPRAVKEALTNRCVRSLAAYRKHCASPSSVGQLVLPESMKLFPLYVNCLIRHESLSGGPELTVDERATAMARCLCADVKTSLVSLYPRLLSLATLPATPQQMRCFGDKLNDDGVYLLENGVHMLVWVGLQAPPELLQDLFGVANAQQIDTSVAELPELENDVNAAARELVERARLDRRRCMRMTIIRQRDKLEAVFRQLLVEDRGPDGAVSYVDFLCHVHKEIRALL